MSTQRSVRAFAPATVSNVACGFDVLGFAIEQPGDEVVAQRRGEPGVEIVEITGDGGRLPREVERNTAGVAAAELLARLGDERGVALRLHKGMPLSSGLGSSAASAVAAVCAVDRLLGLEAPRELLLRCALEGERAATGSIHADNAAPCLYGGFVLIRGVDPPDVVPLPVPEGLACAVVRPHAEVETRGARALLGNTVALKDAVTQWGNLGALVAALFRGDHELLSRSLRDVVAEPMRAGLVPGFSVAQRAAAVAGALGCSLSGSGPSIFALCASHAQAEHVATAMVRTLEDAGLTADRLVSPVGAAGARVVLG